MLSLYCIAPTYTTILGHRGGLDGSCVLSVWLTINKHNFKRLLPAFTFGCPQTVHLVVPCTALTPAIAMGASQSRADDSDTVFEKETPISVGGSTK
jgi:hypothetical protein